MRLKYTNSLENFNRDIKKFAFLISIVIGLNFTQFAFDKIVYFAIIALAALYNIFKGNRLGPILAFLFLLECLVSILINTVDMAFQPYSRLALLALTFVAVGPMMIGKNATNFKYFLLKFLFNWLIIIIVLSVICYFFRIPLAFGRAGFKGVASHAMDLAPIASIVLLYTVDKILRIEDKKEKCLFVMLLLLSVFILFVSASRGALVGFVVASLAYIFFRERNVGRCIKYILMLSVLGGGLVALNPGGMMLNFEAKMERVENDGDISGGRMNSLMPRFLEFEESPVFGIGFSTMKYTRISSDGYFEPGSGWVFILSSTGLLGFLFAFFLNITAIFNVWRNPNLVLYSSIAIFFMVHSCIEGYILTVGNPLCVLLWLNIGFLADKKNLYLYG